MKAFLILLLFQALLTTSGKKPLPTTNLDPDDQLRIGVKVGSMHFPHFSFDIETHHGGSWKLKRLHSPSTLSKQSNIMKIIIYNSTVHQHAKKRRPTVQKCQCTIQVSHHEVEAGQGEGVERILCNFLVIREAFELRGGAKS